MKANNITEYKEKNRLQKYLFVLGIILFSLGITCFSNNFPDNDIWARLIAGGHIVENFNIIKNDFLSYTPTHTWYDHEWGASIIFYLALKYFGDAGLILTKGILTALTILVCYKTVELNQTKNIVPYNILYFVIMIMIVQNSLGGTVRCLMFTSLFFALYLYILEKFRKTNNGKILIFIPLLMVLWSNIHGGCISGLGLICIYIVGEFLNKKQIKPYILTLLFSLLALFVNPYGIKYVQFLFFAATMKREYIAEWASSFQKEFLTSYIRYKIYLIVMLFTQAIYLIQNKINYEKMDKTKILIIIVMTYLSITHIRHQSFFIFTVGTLLYNEFYDIFNKAAKKILNNINEELKKNLILLKEMLIYIMIFVTALPPLLNKNKEIRITETKYPRYAIEFIQINKIEGNLFINFDWGSYAAYKLYPNNLIVMDGRYEEVYNPDLIFQLRDFHILKGDWYRIIRNYKTDVMIIEKKYPVFNEILKKKEWSLIFENNLSGVFVPTKNVKEKYLMPIPIDEYYNKNKFKTNAIKKRD